MEPNLSVKFISHAWSDDSCKSELITDKYLATITSLWIDSLQAPEFWITLELIIMRGWIQKLSVNSISHPLVLTSDINCICCLEITCQKFQIGWVRPPTFMIWKGLFSERRWRQERSSQVLFTYCGACLCQNASGQRLMLSRCRYMPFLVRYLDSVISTMRFIQNRSNSHFTLLESRSCNYNL